MANWLPKDFQGWLDMKDYDPAKVDWSSVDPWSAPTIEQIETALYADRLVQERQSSAQPGQSGRARSKLKPKKRNRRPAHCPFCGSGKVLKIIYGLPGPDFDAEAEKRGWVSGGCCVFDENPKWQCGDCEGTWR